MTRSTSSLYWTWISSSTVNVKLLWMICAIGRNYDEVESNDLCENCIKVFVLCKWKIPSQIWITWFFGVFLYFVFMHRIILFLLAFFARAIIRRHHPYVIGVTGTIGKTTLSTNIAHLLRTYYGDTAVLLSPYHYNGEYGLPLTIIGAKTWWKNPLLWIGVFIRACITYITPYTRYLILEYGIDHPGEMEFLLSIVKPHIAILTPVAPNHLEQFGTFSRYHQAKLLLIESAIDMAIAHESERQSITRIWVQYYGKDAQSDVCVMNVMQMIDHLSVDIHLWEDQYHIDLPVFWVYQWENILPLYLLCEFLHIDRDIICQHQGIFTPEVWRSRILKGLAGSVIIDGSYNGGYESLIRGIESLVPFLGKYRIFCFLWDMRELGDETADLHWELAKEIVGCFSGERNVRFFLVWPSMEHYVVPVLSSKYVVSHSLSSRVLWDAIRVTLLEDIEPTLIYVKWSQNTIFLEEGIVSFLENSTDVALLPRQWDGWEEKKETFFRTLS